MRAIVLGIASALVFIGSALSQETPRSAESPECSKEADALGLHGAERLAFRSQCKANFSGPSSQAASAPSSTINTIVFPKGISSIYSQESQGQARMHTCIDQYNANKATNASGGMKWIEPGGGYYSVCNEQLKTASSSPPPPTARTPINPSVSENPRVPVGGSLTIQECAAKYQAAKAAGMLSGRRWNDFRREECNAEATAGGSRSELNSSSLAALHAAEGKQGRLGLSFDCATVKSASARLICSDQDLTDATQQLGFVYANAKDRGGDPDGTTKAQLAWIKERNTRCGLDNKSNVPVEELVFAKRCMLEAINTRIAEFGDSVGAEVAGAALKTQSVETPQTLSQPEIDAFRKFMSSWSPAPGAPPLDVHFRLKRDGTIDGKPEVLSTGSGALFDAAKNDALRMIQQGQPFKMFRPESYEAWKDLVVTFEASSAQAAPPR